MKPSRIIPWAGLKRFRRTLLRWYRRNSRDLPWRRSADSYRIWVAEIMLQQTRIAAVVPYYQRFLSRFPTVSILARARSRSVLRYWAGLGYYSRARNLQAAAKIIIAEHGGHFPRKFDQARALPGIGDYTARAVLSQAFGVPLAVLDGNVARVLARLGAVAGDLRTPARWRELQQVCDRLLPRQAAREWNQALMELGETVCTPRTPACCACPVSSFCRAHKLGMAESFPNPRKKAPRVRMKIAVAVLLDQAGWTLLLAQPGAHDDVLFSRMPQFPAVEVRASEGALSKLSRYLQEIFGIQPAMIPLLPARHAVTFRSLTLLPFLAPVERLPRTPAALAALLEDVEQVPVSNATRKIAAAARAAVSRPQLQFPQARRRASAPGKGGGSTDYHVLQNLRSAGLAPETTA